MTKRLTPRDAAAELLLRREGRRDLLTFAVETHPAYMVGWHHRIICDALMRVEQGELDRLMIFAPPRHGKSELVSLRFPAWYIGKHPDRQIICTSYNDDLANDFGRKVKNIVESESYQRFFPGVKLASDARAANRWHITQGGIYVSAGLGGTLSGRGGHIIIVDDPLKNREEAESKRMRDRLWDIYESDVQSRLMPGGAIVIMHTRWHDDDLAGRLLAKAEAGEGDRWEVICLPAILDEGEENERSLWPEAFPLDAMKRRRSTTEKRTWVSLYQQKPRPDEGDFFETTWFEEREEAAADEELVHYITGDFAVTASGGDYTEIAVWGMDSEGNIYAVDWWSGQTTSDIWIDVILDMAVKHNAIRFFGETGQIRRSVEPAMKRRMRERGVYIKMDYFPTVSDKRTRALGFQGLCARGMVKFPDTPWADRVVEQLVSFPGRYDDAVDACSLIATAIDKLSLGAKEKSDKREKVDRWDKAFSREDTADNRWKVL